MKVKFEVAVVAFEAVNPLRSESERNVIVHKSLQTDDCCCKAYAPTSVADSIAETIITIEAVDMAAAFLLFIDLLENSIALPKNSSFDYWDITEPENVWPSLKLIKYSRL